MRPATLAGLAVLGTALLAGSASAEGPGVRAGDLLIHPRAQVGVGYDDNLFLEDENDPSEPVNASGVVKVTGGLELSNRSPNKLALELDAELRYQNFFGSDTSGVDEADRDTVERRIDERSGIEFGKISATAGLLPKSPVSIDLREELRFSDRPSFEADADLIGDLFERLENAIGADLRFHPGPNPESRPFEALLGYRLRTVRFLGDDAPSTRFGEKTAHEGQFLTRWKFLPKTALEAELRLHVNDYEPVSIDLDAPDAEGPDRDSRPFQGLVGLRGLITNRISTVLRVGYGNTFNASGESFAGVIGQAEIKYALEPTLTTTLGYQRNGRDTAFSNFVTVDRLYAGADLYFAERWHVGGKAGYGRYAYSTSNQTNRSGVTGGERVDPILSASATVGLELRDWLGVEALWQLEKNTTDYEVPPEPNGPLELAAYTRNLVMVSVTSVY